MAAPAFNKDVLRRMTFEYYLQNGIKSDDELDLFVQEFFGFKLPQHNICPEHTTPFSFLADQFFERARTSVGFANRGGGKTIIVAMLNILDALFKPGVEIASAGAIIEQADRGYEYLRKFLFEDPLLLGQVESSIRSETVFRNGSVVRVIAGTYHGLNSPHPQKFRCDEIELMPWVVLQEGLQMSIEKKGFAAQDTLTSTRKFQKGTMQRMLDESEAKGAKVYSWCIFETLEKCTRQCKSDPVYGNCPAYETKDKEGNKVPLCGGIAHDCKGWYKIEDFVKKVRILDKDTWETQWRNLRPSGAILVYGDYYKDEEPWVCKPFPIPSDWERVSGIDFGSNFVYLKAAIDPMDGTWYIYHEYYCEIDRSIEEHSKFIGESPDFGFREWIFCDPAGRQAIIDLQRFLRKYKGPTLISANNDVYAGINKVKSFLQRKPNGTPALRIFDWCPKIRKELGQLYCHKVEKDGTPNRDVIVKKDDHAADALRYMIYSYYTRSGHVKTGNIKGLY